MVQYATRKEVEDLKARIMALESKQKPETKKESIKPKPEEE